MKRVLLIVSGGIAAYKALELVRLLREREASVTAILTEGGSHFVTALSLEALTGNRVYTDLWMPTDASGMGHIELSRSADIVAVVPASADIMAKMAAGIADDLATTALLATNKPVLAAPAMNVRMWEHPATLNNVAILRARGVTVIDPDEGPMACGEFGFGRLPDPARIADAILAGKDGPLTGLTALVTSGPTQEPVDPVRYLGNRSSGKQGHAIASALARAGASVTLVTGPTALPDPAGAVVVRVGTSAQMKEACLSALPVDIVVCAAAVADWGVANASYAKIKKDGAPPHLDLVETPDILAAIGHASNRPRLVIGFAAETDNLVDSADTKRTRKGCDWIVANPVTQDGAVFGGDYNEITLVSALGSEAWPRMSKIEVARQLTDKIIEHMKAGHES